MVKINAAEAKLPSLLVLTKERCGDDVFLEVNPEVNVTHVPSTKNNPLFAPPTPIGFWLGAELRLITNKSS